MTKISEAEDERLWVSYAKWQKIVKPKTKLVTQYLLQALIGAFFVKVLCIVQIFYCLWACKEVEDDDEEEEEAKVRRKY